MFAATYAETTASEPLDFVVKTLDYSGTAVFAVTGALAAGKKQMGIFGAVLLGCVTALGGGTLRDIILDIHPVFWISDLNYFSIAMIGTIGAFSLSRYLKKSMTLLTYADAVGLGVFTVVGFQLGFQATQMSSIGILMGVTTGVVGGMIRDVLSGEIPLILHREIYAFASLCGAILYALLSNFQMPEFFTILAAVSTTLGVWFAASHWNLSLSVLGIKGVGRKSSRRGVFTSRFYNLPYPGRRRVFPLRDTVVRKL